MLYELNKGVRRGSWFRNEPVKTTQEPRKITKEELEDLNRRIEKSRKYLKKPSNYGT